MTDVDQSGAPKISVLFVCLGNICRLPPLTSQGGSLILFSPHSDSPLTAGRSPMAEAVFRSLTNNLPSTSHSSSTPSATQRPQYRISHIDSAGTGAYHVLSSPDPRTLSTLQSHGIFDYEHYARKITTADFEEFDYILAMDRENLRDLEVIKGRMERKGASTKAQLRLFGDFGGKTSKGRGKKGGGDASGEEVVDPYYGADNGFEIVFEQVERFSRAFLTEVVGIDTTDSEGDGDVVDRQGS